MQIARTILPTVFTLSLKYEGSPITTLAFAVSPSDFTPHATPSSYTTSQSGLLSMYVPPYTALRRAKACGITSESQSWSHAQPFAHARLSHKRTRPEEALPGHIAGTDTESPCRSEGANHDTALSSVLWVERAGSCSCHRGVTPMRDR
eukprot:scaffold1687_cov405-Prasinococcus_capsulatus_cf.AAC.7